VVFGFGGVAVEAWFFASFAVPVCCGWCAAWLGFGSRVGLSAAELALIVGVRFPAWFACWCAVTEVLFPTRPAIPAIATQWAGFRVVRQFPPGVRVRGFHIRPRDLRSAWRASRPSSIRRSHSSGFRARHDIGFLLDCFGFASMAD